MVKKPFDAAAEKLSALIDGELTADESAQQEIKVIADSPALKQQWLLYHLIGDTLRSDELAFAPNPTWEARFHAALAQEPVVLAPLAKAKRQVSFWPHATAAAFAGVVLVGPKNRQGRIDLPCAKLGTCCCCVFACIGGFFGVYFPGGGGSGGK